MAEPTTRRSLLLIVVTASLLCVVAVITLSGFLVRAREGTSLQTTTAQPVPPVATLPGGNNASSPSPPDQADDPAPSIPILTAPLPLQGEMVRNEAHRHKHHGERAQEREYEHGGDHDD